MSVCQQDVGDGHDGGRKVGSDQETCGNNKCLHFVTPFGYYGNSITDWQGIVKGFGRFCWWGGSEALWCC